MTRRACASSADDVVEGTSVMLCELLHGNRAESLHLECFAGDDTDPFEGNAEAVRLYDLFVIATG